MPNASRRSGSPAGRCRRRRHDRAERGERGAVHAFLEGRIGFLDIADLVERTWMRCGHGGRSLDTVYALDIEARAKRRADARGRARLRAPDMDVFDAVPAATASAAEPAQHQHAHDHDVPT